MGRFAEHEVVLPLVVISELEGKRDHPELGYFARQALRLLDDLRIEHGRLDQPMPVGDGGHAAGRAQPHRPDGLPAGFRLGDNDSRILAVALNLAAEGQRRRPGHQGPAAAGQGGRRSACRRGVPRRARRRLRLDRHGRARGVGGRPRRAVRPGRLELPEARELPCHTGLVLLSARGSALGRVTPDKSVRLVRGDRDAFGLHGRSAEQRVAIDLLLDPEIGIVSLGGRAGTGKSALALCAGLEVGPRAPGSTRRSWSSGRCTPSAARSSATCPAARPRRWAPGRRRSSTPSARWSAGGRRGGHGPRHARGAAADPHPRPLAARRVRDRRRGAVARAQRAAHRALPDRARARGSSSPTTSPSATTCGSAGTTASRR